MAHDTGRTSKTSLVLFWAAATLAMAVVVMWGATQPEDPLTPYIPFDKARHILGFGAVGICGGLMPTARSRLVTLAAVLALGAVVELVQIPLPGRTASIGDLFASTAGAFGGFGLGAAALSALELVRGGFIERLR